MTDDRQDEKIDLPRAGLLSNGRYHVLVSQEGAGYSAFDDYLLTAWREDHRGAGTLAYVRDREDGTMWSVTFEPARAMPARYEAWLAPGAFNFRRVDGDIETGTEVAVAAAHDAELRMYRLINRGDRRRRLQLTTYAEVAINLPEADAGHPVFSKLFVETEYDADARALVARRRPRSPDERAPLLAHAFVHGAPDAYESDRAAFIGRGRSMRDPQGLDVPPLIDDPAADASRLTRTTGPVLDPVLCLQVDVELEPGEEREIVLISAAAYTRQEVIETIRALRRDDVRADALLQSTVREQQLRDALEIGPKNADRYHRLAAGIFRGLVQLGPSSTLRPSSRMEAIEPVLGLHPGRPLVVGRIADRGEVYIARLLLKARDYWRALGMPVQIVLINDDVGSDAVELHEELTRAIAASRHGKEDVVLGHADRLTPDQQIAVQALARLWITGDRAELLRVDHDEPLDERAPIALPIFRATVHLNAPTSATRSTAEATQDHPPETLQFFNGIGGFSEDGTEYVIRLEPENGRLRLPPSPWVNVISNERAGCIVSETGAGYTWAGNSRENRLTPWYNDPVLDAHGEAIYLRDDDSGEIWCPTPGPVADPTPVEVRHGFGYTRFTKHRSGIAHETTVFVPREAPLKITHVRLRNEGDAPRRLSAAAYAQWVAGSTRRDRRFIVTEYHRETGSILARNPRNEYLGEAWAFATFIVPGVAEGRHTTVGPEFLGPLGDPAHPAALLEGDREGELNGRTGAVADPCAAFLRSFEMAPGGTAEVIFVIGQVEDVYDLSRRLDDFRTPDGVDAALEDVRAFWRDITSVFRVESPSPAIDLMLNGWLVYQNLSCRLWGRSALYQSGGAFGFRDQLQDAGSLAAIRPQIPRDQILLHASHQFEDGDVLHWWHPQTRRGIRTRFSDDLLWLPYITLHYVETTGDASIWDEVAPYVRGAELPDGVDEILMDAVTADLSESVYEHCRRAIDRSLGTGEHGLPLMGSGDWNDGMNRVGRSGKGESVWLAFFLLDILRRFAAVCESRGDVERASAYRRHAERLRESVNDAGWDGSWYRRAYYDNGDPLGSSENDEAKIDALAQAWAVLSGAAPEARARQALDALEEHLVDEEAGIIRLLTPPFDRTANDPGYIRGYLPGVRENGGQYTHAALWVVKAMAEAGRCDRAAPLLEMLSPVSHGGTEAGVKRYRVEPYVIAADVYGAPPHVGRGGWTWYTGSAGWMLRVGLESIFGIRIEGGDTLEIAPCIPATWNGFRVGYRHSDAVYEIRVSGSGRVVRARLDGEEIEVVDGRASVPLRSGSHEVELDLGG